MTLPYAMNEVGSRKKTQTVFGGLNHNPGAGDGELYAMRNLGSDYYPLLATRQRRLSLAVLEKPNGLFAWEKLAWVDGTGFYYDGALKGEVTDGEKSFGAIGGVIVIMPDKKYYDTRTDSFGSLEAEITAQGAVFRDGTLFGETAIANTLYCEGADWGGSFRAGDAVTIRGSSESGNN